MFTEHQNKYGRFNARKKVLSVIGMSLFIVSLTVSCVHDPLQGADTGSGPTDPPDNPPGEEPLGIPCNPDTVYFEKDVLPILQSNCAKSGCHDAISHEEGIVLESYLQVIQGGDIRPFDLGDSELYEVITESDPDKRMPPPPNQQLTPEQINLIARWINQGAGNYVCDEQAGACDTTNVTWAGFVAPLLTNYCVGCHSGTAPSGDLLLNSHASAKSVALDGRLLGALTGTNGYTLMPFGGAPLSDCQINKIKNWIDEGALNN